MKALPLYWPMICLFLAILLLGAPATMLAQHEERDSADAATSHAVREWQMRWETDTAAPDGSPSVRKDWFKIADHEPLASLPKQVSAASLRLQLPELTWEHNTLFIERLYGKNVQIYIGGELLYEAERNHLFDVHQILLPIEPTRAGQELMIRVDTATARIGLDQPVVVGEYGPLLKQYVQQGLFDIVLGAAFMFIALIMLVCSAFLQREQLKRWISLLLIILPTGMMIITYSPYLYTFYPQIGKVAFHLFDLSLLVLLPSLTYFFERMMEGRKLGFLTKFRKFQVGYSLFCLVCSITNILTDYVYYDIYFMITVVALGCIMLVQLSLLFIYSVYFAFKGNKVALIFSTGFMIFAMLGIIDLILFYLRAGNYDLILWKWGIVCFVVSLIIILGRRFASDHKQLITYSKELEMFNTRLQRSEKMEIISGLAASVAHEVRNPLQVTRGFLQLLRENSSAKDRHYMALAIDELDRASHIITDFLTFAKPELEEVSVLNIALELKHIEGILLPLANLQGGTMVLDIPAQLYIRGNSSKLKQAFINIIKNSIEALNGQGEIRIWAYKEQDEVVVHIKDDGEGMNAAELAKLGEPYFSNKTKGTGLGLMVTFRIIEVMQGKLEFRSVKGVGTEAVLRFPSVGAPV